MFNKLSFRIVQRYRHTTIPRVFVLLLDLTILTAVFLVVELLESHHATWDPTPIFITKLIEVIAVASFSFLITGTYRNVIRHSGMNDIILILLAMILPIGVLSGVYALNNVYHAIDKRILFNYREILEIFTLLAMGMIISRLMVQRIYNQYFRRKRLSSNVVVYGAGAAGIIAYNALKQDMRRDYNVVAYIDDDESKLNQKLNAIPIMRSRSVLSPNFIKRKKINLLLIAIPSIRTNHKQAIINKCLSLGIAVKAVPHINKWINGSFRANQIEDIKIEDLLGRESINLDNSNVIREVSDKVVMVTGAAGSIGSEMCRQLMKYNPRQVIMLDQAESPMYDLQFELRNNDLFRNKVERMVFIIANVKDRRRMEEVFDEYHPQVIYHAAAYKHVPFMEENPYEAVYVNVFGTKNLADLAIKYQVEKFVMISTDKAVNPTNVMGASKRMAEIYTQSRNSATHFITTRFGNVLGSNGSVIPLFRKQLAAGGPLTVTHRDIIRYFMTIPEACSLVLEAGSMGSGGDIFVFDMGKPVKIYDLAQKMIQLSGMSNIEIKEIGLRPGEKLYEELLATKENTIPTYHPKIMHAMVNKYSTEEVDKSYGELAEVLGGMDNMKIVEKMKTIVPEFVSNNSIYCQLDNAKQPEE